MPRHFPKHPYSTSEFKRSAKSETLGTFDIHSILIIGRRWFQKSYGNTYNTAEIFINGKLVHKTEKQYGYGNHFLDIAADWLEENGFMPGRKHYPHGGKEPLWQYYRDRHKVDYHYETIDVPRERDL